MCERPAESMPSDFVESKVREIVAEQLGLGEEDVQLDTSFSGDLGADNLDFMEVIMSLEEEFEIEIDDEDAATFKTVGDVVDFLSKRSQ